MNGILKITLKHKTTGEIITVEILPNHDQKWSENVDWWNECEDYDFVDAKEFDLYGEEVRFEKSKNGQTVAGKGTEVSRRYKTGT